MLNRLVVSCTFVCAVGSAHAAWGLKFEVSNDNGATWTSSVNANVGDVIKFRVGSYFDTGTPVTTTDGTGAAVMLNRFTGSNQWTNFSHGDTISGLRLSLPSGNNALLNTSGGTIGTTSPQSFGTNLAHGTLPESPINYTELYTGNITIGDGATRTMIWGSKTFGSGNVKGLTFYNAGSPVNKISGQPDGSPTHITAAVNVNVPAPSAMALLGLGGLVIARRRRATESGVRRRDDGWSYVFGSKSIHELSHSGGNASLSVRGLGDLSCWSN